jgi:hypothetical protein
MHQHGSDDACTASSEMVAIGLESLAGQQHVPCKLLLCGRGEKGQQAVAGALLRVLGSTATIAVVSLPHIVLAGNGDAAQGCVSLVREAMSRHASAQSSRCFWLLSCLICIDTYRVMYA